MNNIFIPCAKWVRRGIAKSKPEVVQLSKEELKGLVEKAKKDILLTAENISCPEGNAGESNVTNGDQFGLEDYDKEDDVQTLIGIGNLVTFDDELEKNDSEEQDDYSDEDDSDREDDEIKPTDNLIAVGHVYGDMSVLEVYVFNEEDNDLYIHHDIVLPTIPLTLEWLNFTGDSSTPGNLLALGGMTPEITIWNLDIVNSLEPLLTLGKFSNKKKHRHRNHGHTDAVLDLSWNSKLLHVLASGSVDRRVLLWDLEKAKSISQFTQFQEKVQTLDWHPSEENLLMAGACDGTVQLLDCRLGHPLHSVKVDGEVERVVWHPTNQLSALVGTSKGLLYCVDFLNGKPLWEIKAHDREVTGIAVHIDQPNSVITCSTDQTVKLWTTAGERPLLVHTRNTNLGELQCLQICPDNPSIICIGGNSRSNNFKILDLRSEMQTGNEEVESMETDLPDS